MLELFAGITITLSAVAILGLHLTVKYVKKLIAEAAATRALVEQLQKTHLDTVKQLTAETNLAVKDLTNRLERAESQLTGIGLNKTFGGR